MMIKKIETKYESKVGYESITLGNVNKNKNKNKNKENNESKSLFKLLYT